MTWRSVCGLVLVASLGLLLWLTAHPAAESGQTLGIHQALFKQAEGLNLPNSTAGWPAVTLPAALQPVSDRSPRATWFRMRFDLSRPPTDFWGVLLPYLYGGGEVWLNGQVLGDIPSSTDRLRVRWERPHLLALPASLLHAGTNDLWVRAVPSTGESILNFPQPSVGPLTELRPAYDRRYFWAHTMQEFTVAACLVVSGFVLLIWWRLPQEVLYGWFAIAALLWGVRTSTFLMEVVLADRWLWWRFVYLATTGGFAVVMAIFALRLSALRQRSIEIGLLIYGLAGPAWFLLHGLQSNTQLSRIWIAGLIPISACTAAVAMYSARRQRTASSLLLPGAFALATLCGAHDYLVGWKPEWFERVAPGWAGQRYFLLHHGANVLLLAMGLQLSARFTRSVQSLRELNQTLEARVADRERSLTENYARLAQLERQNAASEERQLIMREIHDGLGSKLFTSLSRVERGAMSGAQMAQVLRACISDMRLALDALAPDDHDLLTAFGDFMFRWQAELQAAGVRCEWTINSASDDLRLPPHVTLKVLRVAQEALTNVVKHARATRVALALEHRSGHLRLSIRDDGVGVASEPSRASRGMQNMRARAEQLGGTLEVSLADAGGTSIVLMFPLSLGEV